MNLNIDEELRLTVIDALRANLMIDSSEIGVAVEKRVATLTGKVGGYYQKQAAEKTTRRISGIRGVAEELEVALPGPHKRSDTEIAQAAASAIQWNALVPDDVKVTVEKGWLTLTGTTEWSYQKQAAQNAVRMLLGVTGVTNQLEIKQSTPSATIKAQIEDTLKLASERDAKGICVETAEGIVTLTGTVRSQSEKNDASRTAWNAPGVAVVHNEIQVL